MKILRREAWPAATLYGDPGPAEPLRNLITESRVIRRRVLRSPGNRARSVMDPFVT